MDNDTSSTGSVTPNVDPPVTGTSTPGSVTPQKSALTLEEALKRIADLEHEHRNAREAEDRLGKKLSAYEKKEKEALAAKKADEEAQLSEIERIKKQHAELQAQHDTYTHQMQERIVRYEVEQQARKLGIIDEDAAVRLLDWSELEFNEGGTPTNAAKLLEKLVKDKPYLAPKQDVPAQPSNGQPSAPAQPVTPAIPAMNPGRSSIPSPNAFTPGKPVRLSDVYKRP
jgi:hypothetical protein